LINVKQMMTSVPYPGVWTLVDMQYPIGVLGNEASKLMEQARGGAIDLRRRLTLPLLVLYGLGVTVGAGIYVLIGTTANEAGIYAPVSFLLAAIVVAFTGYSYAELSTRFPVSAGEAVYVQNGLKSRRLSTLVGLMVATSGVVSAAAISIGAAAYLHNFTFIPTPFLTVLIVLCLGAAAIWGILESVTFASILTVLEIAGLVLVVIFGFVAKPDLLTGIADLIPPPDPQVWSGIGAASLLAFFAFVGFEDLANIAEEAVAPERNMPRAIILTLLIATLVYLVVVVSRRFDSSDGNAWRLSLPT
jgi:APA family basic amino acid/polyamine antiporter